MVAPKNLGFSMVLSPREKAVRVETNTATLTGNAKGQKILVISDIHSNMEAFKAVLAQAETWDRVVFVGDAVGYGASPNEVIAELKQLDVVGCMGNHDYAVLSLDTDWFNERAVQAIRWTNDQLTIASKSWLANLPSRNEFSIANLSVGLVHGSPRRPLYEYVMPNTSTVRLEEDRKEMNVDILVLGHTHVPFIKEVPGGIVFNPGSVGQPRDGDPRASYIQMEVGGDSVDLQIRRVEYPIEKASSKIYKAGLPPFLGDRLYLGR